MILKIRVLITCLSLICLYEANAQNFFIRSNDTNYVITRTIGRDPSNSASSTYIHYLKHESLADGIYYLCSSNKRRIVDSCDCLINYRARYLIVDSQIQGPVLFNYYNSSILESYFTFENDILNGFYFSTPGGHGKLDEGFFQKGKLHGPQFVYFRKDKRKKEISPIEMFFLYDLGKLTYWLRYYQQNGMVYIKADCIYPERKCECEAYDILGTVHFRSKHDSSGKLLQLSYFDSLGILSKEVIGEFEKPSLFYFGEFIDLFKIWDAKLKSGVIRIFSQGELKEENFIH